MVTARCHVSPPGGRPIKTHLVTIISSPRQHHCGSWLSVSFCRSNCGSSVIIWAPQSAKSRAVADCRCQKCCVYLGRPWLHLQCCQAPHQSRCRGWCFGRGSEGLRREVKDASLDKGLAEVLYLLTGIPACGYCLAWFITRQGLCKDKSMSRFSACISRAKNICQNCTGGRRDWIP